jgi:endoglucanase
VFNISEKKSIKAFFPKLALLFILITGSKHSLVAKSQPTPLNERQIAFKRAKSLGNGVSVSRLEQTWNKNILSQNPIATSDFKLLKQLGIKSLRLPVAFNYFDTAHISIEKVITHIDDVLKQCKLYDIKLIIDYHYGNLNDNNCATENPKIIALWLTLTKRYIKESPDNLF